MYKILGFSVFESKAGKKCCTIQLAKEFSDFEKKKGCLGLKIEKRRDGSDIFLPDSLMSLVSEENVGAECEAYFSASGGLMDIRIL